MTRDELRPYADRFEKYVNDFITPLSYDSGGDKGVLCGTGAFISKDDRVYLITNAHIICKLEEMSKGKDSPIVVQCLFKDWEEYVPITAQFKKTDGVVDVAIADITEIWNEQKNNARKAIPLDKFKPTENRGNEYFYTVGYPSLCADMEGDVLNSPPQKFLTIEAGLPNLADREFMPYCHFALKYSSKDCYYTRSEMHLCHDPRGISGSLVWNTHLTDEMIRNGHDWDPESMTIAGVEFLWDENETLVCSKSEAIPFVSLM